MRDKEPNNFTDTELRLLGRIRGLGEKRGKKEIAETLKCERAIRATILQLLGALDGEQLSIDIWAALEVFATKTNAARIASHPLRLAADAAAIEARKAEIAKAREVGRTAASEAAEANSAFANGRN